ncbi:L-threonylcarbamoyladenylate synthase [Neogemmobacter tilapiae]|uniref:Threonylcarbamoyl-AMP synthase n=1 Tax=Neogemmobacter tilapiae TaxID=875041 RepID=A0A918TWY6_9RHOB|nr:L-threonylcarbamoyladenylate synthase [Gemmobacter tilapiae]GHC66030.1 threonylcarbamoyl-AMP synthase [Gemmobacter tilapiae]
MTEVLSPDAKGIARAAALLSQGALVAIPTETVYGLAGDARSDQAVAAIYTAKGRPSFNPLIVHLAKTDQAALYAHVSDQARALMAAFWPGPLTLVLPLHDGAGLSPLVTAGLPSVALRQPAHRLAQALLTAFDGPLAAPSANPSGRVSSTTATHVLDGLSGRIAAVLDGGACTVGVESTIIGLADGPPRLLRPGGIGVEEIEGVLGQKLATAGEGITAPGQLASHYAPGAGVVLNATERPKGAIWVGFGPKCAGADLNLSVVGSLTDAACNLFDMLRKADALAGPGGQIAFAPVPRDGLGLAINDRLQRAAAPR